MKILITGGCGNIGTYVTNVLSRKGHELRIVDIDEDGLQKFSGPNITTIAGDISNKNFTFKIVEGMDAIIHLAWSFSDNMIELFDIDVKGYMHILEAALKHNVKHTLNTSTAVVYGKPQYKPVDESHPRLVEIARKPMYALAKLVTEKLSQIYGLEHGLGVNTIIIWYAYGSDIGGKHLRNMIKNAIEKGIIEVPEDCGGTFLQLDDLISGLEGIFKHQPKGKTFNLGTVYLTWEELAAIIVAKANPKAKIISIPKDRWTGSTFLTDDWELSLREAEDILDFKTNFTKKEAIDHLGKALDSCISKVKMETN